MSVCNYYRLVKQLVGILLIYYLKGSVFNHTEAYMLIITKAFYVPFPPVFPISILLSNNQSLDTKYGERRAVEQHWFKSCIC